MSLADDRKFAEVLAGADSFEDLLVCAPEKDRHVWKMTANMDESTGEITSTSIAPDGLCQCGARRYDDRDGMRH